MIDAPHGQRRRGLFGHGSTSLSKRCKGGGERQTRWAANDVRQVFTSNECFNKSRIRYIWKYICIFYEGADTTGNYIEKNILRLILLPGTKIHFIVCLASSLEVEAWQMRLADQRPHWF